MRACVRVCRPPQQTKWALRVEPHALGSTKGHVRVNDEDVHTRSVWRRLKMNYSMNGWYWSATQLYVDLFSQHYFWWFCTDATNIARCNLIMQYLHDNICGVEFPQLGDPSQLSLSLWFIITERKNYLWSDCFIMLSQIHACPINWTWSSRFLSGGRDLTLVYKQDVNSLSFMFITSSWPSPGDYKYYWTICCDIIL